MSATIYEFPGRGRYAVGQREEVKPVIGFASSRVTKTVLGNSWYHEEAIEAERSPKN